MQVYDDLADAIFRHCYYRVSDRDVAKDLLQETFTRTWEYIGKGGDIKNIKAFLYRVANNLIIDRFRKKKDLSLDELQEKGFDPGFEEKETLHNILDGKYALKILKKMDLKYRQAITMRYVNDLSPREIAAELSESENTISVRVHRGLKKLREELR